MKSLIFMALTLAIASIHTFAAAQPISASTLDALMAQREKLKAFIEHPTHCHVFLGHAASEDMPRGDYSTAVSSLLSTAVSTADLKMVMVSIKTACSSKVGDLDE